MSFTPEAWILVGTIFTGLLTLAGAVYAASRPSGIAALREPFAALAQTVTTLQSENQRLVKQVMMLEAELTDLHSAFNDYKVESERKVTALYVQLGRLTAGRNSDE